MCESVWVTVDDTECYANSSEGLVLVISSLGVHCAYTRNQNFMKSKFSILLHYFLHKLSIRD